MAKQERGVRSNAIREYLKSHPEAGPKAIIADLKAAGVNVSAALVSRIKYGKVGVSGKRARGRRAGTQSESIRAYLMAHPNAKPKEIRLALAEQGLKVGTGLISNVKHNFMKNGKAPSVRIAARRTSASAVAVTVPQLMEVRRLAASLGGLGQLQRAIETLEQLQ